MNIDKTLILSSLILISASCKRSTFHHYVLKKKFKEISYTFRNHAILHPSKDSTKLVFYEIYDSFLNRYKSFGIDHNGRVVYIRDCDRLNYTLKGGTEMYLHKGRLIRYLTYDSLGYVNGPVFIYNKRGKMKYMLEYQHGVFMSILYSSQLKIDYKDTLFLSVPPPLKHRDSL